MFSGIVDGAFELSRIELADAGFGSLRVRIPTECRSGLKIGASVSIDGVCLTVSKIDADSVAFDVVQSTLGRTIVSSYKAGTLVNVERSLTMQDENGGHEVSGHVDTTATVISVNSMQGNHCLSFEIASQFAKYVFPQGYVAINGVSLTISECFEGKRRFSVWLIPETLSRTNLGKLIEGDLVNIEIHRGIQVVVDTITETVTEFLNSALSDGRLTSDVIQSVMGLTLSKATLPKVIGKSDTGDASGSDE